MDGNRLILDVPFRSQFDGTEFQGSNCGPAALAMVLDAFGVLAPTFQVRNLINVQQRSFQLDAGTSLWDLAWIAGQAGLRSNRLNGSASWHRWDWEEVRHEIQLGHPVITLVRMSKLPYATLYRSDTDHYIVVIGLDGDKVLVNDPALPGSQGALKLLKKEELERAWDATSMPRHGASFSATSEVHEFAYPSPESPVSADAAFDLANGVSVVGTPIVVGNQANAIRTSPSPSVNSTVETSLSPSPVPNPISVQLVQATRNLNDSSSDASNARESQALIEDRGLPARARYAAPWMLVAFLFGCGWLIRLA